MPDTTREECSVDRWKKVNAVWGGNGTRETVSVGSVPGLVAYQDRWKTSVGTTRADDGRAGRRTETKRCRAGENAGEGLDTIGTAIAGEYRADATWEAGRIEANPSIEFAGWYLVAEQPNRQSDRGATRGKVPGGYWGNLGRCTPSSVRSREGGGGTYAVECDGPEALVRLTIDCWGWEDGMRMMVHVLGVGGRLTVRLAGGTGLRGPKPAPT
ncbi:unnamed protein product [Clonostachys byssicola]|uniref:Uncharacterized protein n=1 Tax=Clonostachys byssicola TaxID=160290 RepID=A0A9N9Y8C6_9HYPO|nr:unnamed protein product [Clonostachys byssicola]